MTRWIKAEYQQAILPEHKNNPLIEALPKKVKSENVLQALSFYPDCSPEIISEDAIIREEYLFRLDSLRQPLPEYITCFRAVEKALKESYSAKNPLSPTTQHYLHNIEYKDTPVVPFTGLFEAKGSAISLVGNSGVGKSKMLSQILHYFPQVIEHKEYKDDCLNLKQVVWINVDCPHDASLRVFCHTILQSIDRALRQPPTTPEKNIGTLLVQIEGRIRSSFLGILVIDEMQNINIGKAGGSEKMLSFMLNLINRSGVPILFSGNPEFSETFKKNFRNSRRAESGGYIEMRLLSTQMWDIFVKELWALQWTNPPTPITSELSDCLYSLSCGIIDIAVRVYKQAQEVVMGTPDERITVEVLELAYQGACQLTDGELSNIREQLFVNITKDRKQKNYGDNDSGNKILNLVEPELPGDPYEPKTKSITIPGDLTRAHHPEFNDKLYEILGSVNIFDCIKDPDIIRRASEQDDPLIALNTFGILCDDPLKELA